MKQENIHDWLEEAKDLAKAERELEIEHWVKISFQLRNGYDNYETLHVIDIPRAMLERWRWLIKWRMAKYTCQYPREEINMYYHYYDKRTGLETGFNTLLSCLAATKAQVTRIKRITEQYIIQETQNNLFFDPTTDERLQKIRAKLKQKYANMEAMEKKVEEEVIKNSLKTKAA